MKYLQLLSVILFFNSCQNNSEKEYSELNKMSWIIGKWTNNQPNGILTEEWKIENDSTYFGTSYFLINKDTVHNESIRLVEKNNELFYSSIILGQNDNEPIDFILETNNENEILFKTKKVNYPKKIIYSKINDSTFNLKIAGNVLGKPLTENYTMKKIKE